jgi:hypothetical protein
MELLLGKAHVLTSQVFDSELKAAQLNHIKFLDLVSSDKMNIFGRLNKREFVISDSTYRSEKLL